jgi:D-galacturonate reductase
MYADAKERIRALGDFGFFQSYMSQPKFQLHTFSQWAGTGSDISYYLNSHHIDFHCWAMQGIARPTRIVAMKSTGVANSEPFNCPANTEDTITIMTQWENLSSGNVGTAVYTSSWVAPKSDVHTQQRFFYMGHKGEINIDQAHRGYIVTTDENGYSSANPLYMKYTKDNKGRFAGQSGYGYRSIEAFVDAVNKVRSGASKVEEFDNELATAKMTLTSTAIVEAGRRSLDNNGKAFLIKYDPDQKTVPVAVVQE